MSPKEVLRHPISAIRTAPLGMAELALYGTLSARKSVEAAHTHNIGDILAAGGLGIVGGAAGSLLIAIQFRRRSRFKRFIEEHGFDRRAFALTTQEWCDRQTMHVLLEDTEHHDDYKQLCEDKKPSSHLSWLPHI